MDKSNFDWKEHLIACMSSTDYCSVATIDDGGVWVNPVYFAWDDSFNLYFISMAPVRHMKNIEKNPRVAVAIYKTEQKGDVVGVQLEGVAWVLKDEEEKKGGHQVYYGRVGSLEQNEFAMHDPKWLFVKITPEHVYYFDSKVFGEERQTVPMGDLK